MACVQAGIKKKKFRICNVLIGALKFSIGTLIAKDKQSLDTVFIR